MSTLNGDRGGPTRLLASVTVLDRQKQNRPAPRLRWPLLRISTWERRGTASLDHRLDTRTWCATARVTKGRMLDVARRAVRVCTAGRAGPYTAHECDV